MPRRQNLNQPNIVAHIAHAVLSADNTPAALDTRGYNLVELLINAGAGGITFDATNKVEVKLLHGDDTTYANATAVAAADVRIFDASEGAVSLGSGGIVWSIVAALTATSRRIEYIGAKRYLYVLFDFGGTHGAGTIFGVVARLAEGHLDGV